MSDIKIAILNKVTNTYRFVAPGVQTYLSQDEIVIGTQRTLHRKHDLRMCHTCNQKGIFEFT